MKAKKPEKERGIIMSGDNPKLILEGRKTQTRPLIKGVSKGVDGFSQALSKIHWIEKLPVRGEWLDQKVDSSINGKSIRCPYGVAGDRLWVRERHTITSLRKAFKARGFGPLYEVTGHYGDGKRFKIVLTAAESKKYHRRKRKTGGIPSIFMFRSLSRITLEVEKMRVERLQSITGSDAVAEGITYPVRPSDTVPGKCSVLWNISAVCCPLDYIAKEDRGDHNKILVAHYAALFDSLHGKGSWAKNPWVWVIDYKLIKPIRHLCPAKLPSRHANGAKS